MEMSLSLVGRKSEQDPAASSVGGQPPHCSVNRKYVNTPAVPKLTFIPPGACSHTSSWLGVTSCLYHSRRGSNVEHSEKKTLFLCTAQNIVPHCRSPDDHFAEGHIPVVLYLKEIGELHLSYFGLWRKKQNS